MTTNHGSEQESTSGGRDERAAAASRRAAHYDRAWKIAASQGEPGRDAALGVLQMEAYDDDADRMMSTLPRCTGETVAETSMGTARCLGRNAGGEWFRGHAEDCERGRAMRTYWDRRRAGQRAAE
jgi:hypothetical protein